MDLVIAFSCHLLRIPIRADEDDLSLVVVDEAVAQCLLEYQQGVIADQSEDVVAQDAVAEDFPEPVETLPRTLGYFRNQLEPGNHVLLKIRRVLRSHFMVDAEPPGREAESSLVRFSELIPRLDDHSLLPKR